MKKTSGFWRNKIQKQIKYWNKDKSEEKIRHKKKRKTFDISFILPLAIIPAMLILMVTLVSFIGDEINNYDSDIIYTVKVYTPNCENGELIFTNNDVSANYLYNNGLGEPRNNRDHDLTPVNNFQKWEKYVRKITGNDIGYKQICVEFEKI